jgi:hypothetical protein
MPGQKRKNTLRKLNWMISMHEDWMILTYTRIHYPIISMHSPTHTESHGVTPMNTRAITAIACIHTHPCMHMHTMCAPPPVLCVRAAAAECSLGCRSRMTMSRFASDAFGSSALEALWPLPRPPPTSESGRTVTLRTDSHGSGSEARSESG